MTANRNMRIATNRTVVIDTYRRIDYDADAEMSTRPNHGTWHHDRISPQRYMPGDRCRRMHQGHDSAPLPFEKIECVAPSPSVSDSHHDIGVDEQPRLRKTPCNGIAPRAACGPLSHIIKAE